MTDVDDLVTLRVESYGAEPCDVEMDAFDDLRAENRRLRVVLTHVREWLLHNRWISGLDNGEYEGVVEDVVAVVGLPVVLDVEVEEEKDVHEL